MRNFVETCLGGDPLLPEMRIGRAPKLEPDDVLLVCTDGFWGPTCSTKTSRPRSTPACR
jgi:serine/threonine protein phosphatase PrpC